ncbi:MAG: hypothetical protein QM811_19615 [Pirellulales bacterium]
MSSSFLATLREPILAWFERQRWFGGKGRAIVDAGLVSELPLQSNPDVAFQIVRIDYRDGDHELYLTAWPSTWRGWCEAEAAPEEWLRDHAALQAMWPELVAGELPTWRSATFVESSPTMAGEVRFAHFEQSNTCVIVDDALIVKLYRKLKAGVNPDAEIGRFLADNPTADVSPPMYAVLETARLTAKRSRWRPRIRFVAGSKSAWDAALKDLAADLKKFGTTADLRSILSAAVEFAARLGVLTARMHDLLADSHEPAFVPEPWTDEERAAIATGQIAYSKKQFDLLAQRDDGPSAKRGARRRSGACRRATNCWNASRRGVRCVRADNASAFTATIT